MLGYLTMPEKTREVLDADGYLFITGRLKSIIVTKGAKNIYPEEIENLLLQSPLIAECVVIGKLDKEGGEYPHAILYPNADAMKTMEAEAGKSFTDDEIKKNCPDRDPEEHGWLRRLQDPPRLRRVQGQALPVRRGEKVANWRPLARPCAKARSRPSSVADM